MGTDVSIAGRALQPSLPEKLIRRHYGRPGPAS